MERTVPAEFISWFLFFDLCSFFAYLVGHQAGEGLTALAVFWGILGFGYLANSAFSR